MTTETQSLTLPSGRLHVERSGPRDAAETAICVHGLTANVRAFDGLRDDLVAAGVQVIAMDLRGRGHSEDTGPGSYGLPNHARDVVAIAEHLGVERWHHVGWSMGALIGLDLAAVAADRLVTASLLDAAGGMDPAALDAVRAATARLDAVVPDMSAYYDAIRASGIFEPWGPYWERYFAWELAPVDDGLSATTSRAACLEDLEAATRDFSELWAGLTMPTLLVWASVPMNGGLLVPPDVRDAFLDRVPGARLHVVDRNHYALMTDQHVRDAIVAHITRG
ncbi:alpha/beta fold hydrolase [Paraconexibacter sp.]|uniref:alpha/beta fold hydrolase n=1 Tax=Paraconexibacter sp. TaxID=2949640 RepID=UPI0035647D19